MSLSVSISMFNESPDPPSASMLALGDGTRFISLDLSPDVTVTLPGSGSVAADYARRIAAALIEAAVQCEGPGLAPPEMPAPEADLSDSFI